MTKWEINIKKKKEKGNKESQGLWDVRKKKHEKGIPPASCQRHEGT